METLIPMTSGDIKQESDYEGQAVKKEANGEEESDFSPVIKSEATSSTSLSCSDEDTFLYCEICQLKYEGGCQDHGYVIYMDNAEDVQDEGCSQDSSLLVQVADKDRHEPGREKVEQSGVCEAHSDDVGTSPKGDCSRESDQMLSVCEMNTEPCVASTSFGLESEVKHNTGKHFTCDLCGVGFSLKHNLKSHKRTHTGVKPYKCKMCGVGFTRRSNLKSHKVTHTGEKPYQCEICGVGFTRISHLKGHKRTHSGEKPYKCDVCGTGFTQHGNLKDHNRTHTAEKPYKCGECGAAFALSGNLKIHKRTHTAEKPYKCDVCGAVFTQFGNLKGHKRTHTGEKPYKCDVCGAEFAHRATLATHKKEHTGKKQYKNLDAKTLPETIFFTKL